MEVMRPVAAVLAAALLSPTLGISAAIPDSRTVSPIGFTIPVEGFASSEALSPDGRWLAVLSQDGGAVDVISTAKSMIAGRLAIPAASGMTWTRDGLYVTRGYSGTIARYAYDDSSKTAPVLNKRIDIQVDTNGLLNGIAEDPATHRIAVARSADREVVVLDDQTGATLATLKTTGQPFGVAFAGETLVATLYDSDHVDAWHGATGDAVRIPIGPHPTQLLADGTTVYVANADGHDVAAIDATSLQVTRRFDLAIAPDAPPGQTPAGMALSADRGTLYVAESGYDDVAVVDLRTGRLQGRIPTGWYPTAVVSVEKAGDKDTRVRRQLWIASAKGLGSQPDPGGEWDGTYTGLVQHLIVEPNQLAGWTAQVARNDRFALRAPGRDAFPPIKHVVFIVKENKHFDEEFADVPGANGDPALLLYGRHYTPNAHALAERYTLFDNLMTNGESSNYGHAWTTQAMANDYHQRNTHLGESAPADVAARVPWSIWPLPFGGEDALAPVDMDFDWFHDFSELAKGPRVNVSGVFGPRGELIDELARKHISFRVYGEQMTMLPDGRIAPGLAAGAARAYPGHHIDFGVLDTDRAKIFLDDVAAHGLAQYSYLTLPDDHTAGTKAGFFTPASYVANNDEALGEIIAGLSRRADWKDTVVFVTMDDAQGTGDHFDSHRIPAIAIGPYVRRGFVDHTRYSQASILRTTELLLGAAPLSIYDAASTPMLDAFAKQPLVATYGKMQTGIAMEKNPGKAVSLTFRIDGPDSADIPNQEWRSLRGTLSLAAHRRYLQVLGGADLAFRNSDDDGD
jgi:DNA-binding beta-propeller fold protein YncE/phospholipase C